MTNLEKKLILTGITFIVTITVSILGYEYLKGNNPFKADRYFYAVYDNVLGLSETAPVMVNGVQVGQISDIYFKPDGRVVVKFLIENKHVKLPVGSKAQIYSTDMLGTKALRIILAKPSGQYYNADDTLPSDVEVPMGAILEQKMSDLDQIVQKTKNILTKLDQAFDTNTISSLHNSLKSLQNALAILDTTIGQNSNLQKSLAHTKNILANLDRQKQTLDSIVRNTKDFTDKLNRINLDTTLAQLDTTLSYLNEVLHKIKQGQGSVGKLIVYDTVYNQLDSILSDIQYITKYLRQHPRKAFQMNLINIDKSKK